MATSGGQPGHKKAGGRKKGTPNKKTQDVIDKLAALDCDPIEGMAKIAAGECGCTGCEGKGKVTIGKARTISRFSIGDDESDVSELTTCPRCGGDKTERVDLMTRFNSYKELAQYVEAKRKALDIKADVNVNTQDQSVWELSKELGLNSD